MKIQAKTGGEFTPHPEGIHHAVCVDVIDLGLVKTDFQGQEKMVPKVKIIWETEARLPDGTAATISKNFTASLHPKASLNKFIGQWRGRPVLPDETVDLDKLIGANCTLVISHQQNMVGRTYAAIDAISKPSKKIAASGTYDAKATRQRIADWQAKSGTSAPAAAPATPAANPAARPVPARPTPAPAPTAQPVPADNEDDVPF